MEEYPSVEAYFMPEGLFDHSLMLVRVYPEITEEDVHFDILKCGAKLLDFWSV